MSDQGFPGDRTEISSRERRKVPAVTDVVDAVARSRGIPPERRPEVFRAAQQVCAEELRLARTGFAPASLAELVDRAAMLLPRDLGGERHPIRGWDEDAPFPEEPLAEIEPVFSPEDPFGGEPSLAAEWMEEAVDRAAAPRLDAAPEPEPEAEPEEVEAPDEPEELEFATVEDSSAAASGGRLVAVLLVLAIAGGVWFFARTKRAPAPPAETPQPPPASASLPPAATSGPLSAPGAGSSAAPPLPSSAAASPGSDAGGIPESRGSAMISPDWSGRPPAWMIHFSSFQRKENADRDAARLGKLLGRPLRVVSVNLGKPGLWYRVMLGEYTTRDEAQRERDALAAKGTPGVGLVYRVTAP